MLSPQFTRKNYIRGDQEICNYELYLTELINQCPNFMSSFDEPFRHVEKQSNKEPDAISNNYGIDYKMIASQSGQHANSVLKSQIYRMDNGGVAYGISKCPDRTMTVTRIFAALRQYSLEDLISIRGKENTNFVEDDVISYLKTIETKKNLLLFFPYKFWYEPSIEDMPSAIDGVVNALQHDFQNSMLYRSNIAPMYDTYFATIYETYFLIMKVQQDGFVLLDSIDTDKSPIYKRLDDYDDWI